MLVNYEDVIKELNVYERWHFKENSTTIGGIKKHLEKHLVEQTPKREQQQLVIVWQDDEGCGKHSAVINDVLTFSSDYKKKTKQLELTVDFLVGDDEHFNTFYLDLKKGDFFIFQPYDEGW